MGDYWELAYLELTPAPQKWALKSWKSEDMEKLCQIMYRAPVKSPVIVIVEFPSKEFRDEFYAAMKILRMWSTRAPISAPGLVENRRTSIDFAEATPQSVIVKDVVNNNVP